MILKTEKKEVKLRITTRKIVDLTEKNKSKNLHEFYFRAMKDCNVNSLAHIILELSEDENGKKMFNGDINAVYDFIDGLLVERNCSYSDLFSEIAEWVNEQGFFLRKMSKEELEKVKNDPIADFDIQGLIRTSAEKVLSEEASAMFKGHKA